MFLCKQTSLLPLTKTGINCECQARIKRLYCCSNTICICTLHIIIDLNNVILVLKLKPLFYLYIISYLKMGLIMFDIYHVLDYLAWNRNIGNSNN